MITIKQTLETPWNIKVKRGFLSLKFLPHPFGIAHNGMSPLLCMHENFFEVRAAFRKKKIQYDEIEKVEFRSTEWYKNHFTFYPKNSCFCYSIWLSFKEDAENLLKFLEKRGINITQV